MTCVQPIDFALDSNTIQYGETGFIKFVWNNISHKRLLPTLVNNNQVRIFFDGEATPQGRLGLC